MPADLMVACLLQFGLDEGGMYTLIPCVAWRMDKLKLDLVCQSNLTSFYFSRRLDVSQCSPSLQVAI